MPVHALRLVGKRRCYVLISAQADEPGEAQAYRSFDGPLPVRSLTAVPCMVRRAAVAKFLGSKSPVAPPEAMRASCLRASSCSGFKTTGRQLVAGSQSGLYRTRDDEPRPFGHDHLQHRRRAGWRGAITSVVMRCGGPSTGPCAIQIISGSKQAVVPPAPHSQAHGAVTENYGVGGSIPSLGTIITKNQHVRRGAMEGRGGHLFVWGRKRALRPKPAKSPMPAPLYPRASGTTHVSRNQGSD